MEKVASKSETLETAAGPVTPLPVGMGIDLTWTIVG
jgi:dihydroorotase